MEDKYKNIRELGLQVFIKPYDDYQWVVSADELISILKESRVVYGTLLPNMELSAMRETRANDSTLQGLLINVKPLSEKTKEEKIEDVIKDYTISPTKALELIREIVYDK